MAFIFPDSIAMEASFTILIPGLCIRFRDSSINVAATPFFSNWFSASLAKIAQPSIGIAFVRMIESPSLAPEDLTSLPFSTSPNITPDIKGRSIPAVISV